MSGRDFDETFRWISAAPVALFGIAFALGLLLYLFTPGSSAAATALHAGILLLISSPAVRMAVATAERVHRRDWPFVLMILVIAAEILLVLWRSALQR